MVSLSRLCFAGISAAILTASIGCGKKFEIRDVDPGRPGTVRNLGPESQDAIQLSDQLTRSLLSSRASSQWTTPPTIVLYEFANNTRHAFSGEVFSSRLKVELARNADGRIMFVARDMWDAIVRERELKRSGQADYDPNLRSQAQAGGDYFLKGRADGLAAVSTKGQSDYILYTYKLVDAETGIEVWEDSFETKREGRDDVIYR